jgi:alpha-pyrone synthase
VTNTGYYTPGVDFGLIEACGLSPSVERTQVAFMGCYAGVTGLRHAHHIVRSHPEAKVLVVVLELCSLHLRHTKSLEQMLSMLIFGDGCGAALVTARELGVALDSFQTFVIPGTQDLMTLRAGPHSIEVHLSGQVPLALNRTLRDAETIRQVLRGQDKDAIATWAIHPGGRSILDAVGTALDLGPVDLEVSRHVLDRYGNTASAAILFVFEEILRRGGGVPFRGTPGCALAFGPGLTAETLLFRT